MVIKLTETDISNLMREAQQQGEQVYSTTEFGTQDSWLKQIGKGHHHFIDLRGGLTIYILEGQLYQHLTLKKRQSQGRLL